MLDPAFWVVVDQPPNSLAPGSVNRNNLGGYPHPLRHRAEYILGQNA